jgi:hypothetical protein
MGHLPNAGRLLRVSLEVPPILPQRLIIINQTTLEFMEDKRDA